MTRLQDRHLSLATSLPSEEDVDIRPGLRPRPWTWAGGGGGQVRPVVRVAAATHLPRPVAVAVAALPPCPAARSSPLMAPRRAALEVGAGG